MAAPPVPSDPTVVSATPTPFTATDEIDLPAAARLLAATAARGPRGVLDYFTHVATAAKGAELYAYLFPALTGTTVAPAQLANLVRQTGLTGIKVSISGTSFLAEATALLPEGTVVLTGKDALIAAVRAAGGHGVASGVSPVAPTPFLELAAAVAANETERIAHPQWLVDRLVAALGAPISLAKWALAEQRLITTKHTQMAIDAPTVAERDAIRGALADLAVTA